MSAHMCWILDHNHFTLLGCQNVGEECNSLEHCSQVPVAAQNSLDVDNLMGMSFLLVLVTSFGIFDMAVFV